jgi:hypothetical protein
MLIIWFYRVTLFIPDNESPGWAISCFLYGNLLETGSFTIYCEILDTCVTVAETCPDAKLRFICKLKLWTNVLLYIFEVEFTTGCFNAIEPLLYVSTITIWLVSGFSTATECIVFSMRISLNLSPYSGVAVAIGLYDHS